MRSAKEDHPGGAFIDVWVVVRMKLSEDIGSLNDEATEAMSYEDDGAPRTFLFIFQCLLADFIKY